MSINKETLETVLKNFKINGNIIDSQEMKSGHINDTVIISILNDKNKIEKFTVQRINVNLFKNYKELMNNIVLVTEHIRSKIEKENKNPKRYCLNFLKTEDNVPYCVLKKQVYRAYKFIDNSLTYSVIDDEKIFYKSALAFANFAKHLDDFDPKKLFEVIPDFHNTRVRYKNFLESLDIAIEERKVLAEKEINFAKENSDIKDMILDYIKTNEVPLRVTHNDTKLNNVLIDATTNEALAVIDLDTVMPGSILYDFGDAIRFGCNSAKEDEIDLEKVNFRINYFKEYAKGYLEVLGDKLTKKEIELLHLSGIVMTYECGIRFLSDFLVGDKYFKISRKNHNLDRARTQFKLVKDMLNCKDELKNIVESLKHV